MNTRYPGAQPFTDDPFSHRIFFGREQAIRSLTDQIVANQLVVVYGRSGLGKTSLLNAGVSPKLREEGFLPLFVRLNDVQKTPIVSIFESIGVEARRQNVEYVQGETDSLWSFFKTAEFWRGDLLLTPVLVLDQFEELFTLHERAARQQFLSELSWLTRGVRPESADTAVSEKAPAIRIIVSLREDFLAFLEEAAYHLPGILDHRFRLAALTWEAAATAITAPAMIEDASLKSRVFSYAPETVHMILTFLARRRSGNRQQEETSYIEPFQLQLICQHLENVVILRQAGKERVNLTEGDIGGEDALRNVVKQFYTNAVSSLSGASTRRRVHRLCEDVLISSTGRRLSVEENEIRMQVGVTAEILSSLVGRRLLRSDNRADSIYYEISHDTLIVPILAARRWRTLFRGAFGVMISLCMLIVTSAMLVAGIHDVITTFNNLSLLLVSLGVLPLLLFFLNWMRSNLRVIRRYRFGINNIDSQSILREWEWKFLVDAGVGICIAICGIFLLALGSVGFTVVIEQPFTAEKLASLVLCCFSVCYGTVIICGKIPIALSFGRRARAFVETSPLLDRLYTRALESVFVIGLFASMLLVAKVLLKVACISYYRGTWPSWVPLYLFDTGPAECRVANQKGLVDFWFEAVMCAVFFCEMLRQVRRILGRTR